MEAKIMVLPDKGPELCRPEFSRPERSEKFVGIDRVCLEFQDKRFDVGRGSLNRAHSTHTRNGKTHIANHDDDRMQITRCSRPVARQRGDERRCRDFRGVLPVLRAVILHNTPGCHPGNKCQKVLVFSLGRETHTSENRRGEKARTSLFVHHRPPLFNTFNTKRPNLL